MLIVLVIHLSHQYSQALNRDEEETKDRYYKYGRRGKRANMYTKGEKTPKDSYRFIKQSSDIKRLLTLDRASFGQSLNQSASPLIV